jgi:hypothetical protein
VANATDIVKLGKIGFDEPFFAHSTATLSAETTFWPNALLGWTTGGYLAKFDDTQSLILAGIVREDHGASVLPAGTAGDAALELAGEQPRFLKVAVASAAVTDIGRNVYALFDQTGTFDAGATTYGNLIGRVARWEETGYVVVELALRGTADNRAFNATRVLAATGTQSLTKWDMGKLIVGTSTSAHALNLPAVADVQYGAEFTLAKKSSNAAAITITGSGAENIDGSNTLATVDAAYDTVIVRSLGTEWVVIARDIT